MLRQLQRYLYEVTSVLSLSIPELKILYLKHPLVTSDTIKLFEGIFIKPEELLHIPTFPDLYEEEAKNVSEPGNLLKIDSGRYYTTEYVS